MSRERNRVLLWVIALCVLVALFLLYRFYRSRSVSPPPKLVHEEFVATDLAQIERGEGRFVEAGRYEQPISGVVREATLSSTLGLRAAYDVAILAARTLLPDPELIAIRSVGMVEKDGESGEWQVLFGSKTRRVGVEVLVYNGAAASVREVPSATFGYPLPLHWYDSGDALVSLRTQGQFATATVSAINFFYNEDGKRWGYAIATSKGTVSMAVK